MIDRIDPRTEEPMSNAMGPTDFIRQVVAGNASSDVLPQRYLRVSANWACVRQGIVPCCCVKTTELIFSAVKLRIAANLVFAWRAR